MAFECQGEIELKESPANCLHNLETDSDRSAPNQPSELYFESQKSIPDSRSSKLGIPLDGNRALADLPSALISEIFNFLDPKELGIISCVNTYLYRLATEHHVWKEFYYERWGHPTASVNAGPGGSEEKSWKELFVEREFRSKTFMGRYSIDTLYGHKEAVRTVFVLASKKLVFTSGYDQVVRMWDLEEGLLIASSRILGCTIRAVTADSRLLIAGGTDGFIHGWKVDDGNPRLFDLSSSSSSSNQTKEFRVWEHQGPVTCLALDAGKMYSSSWDMTVRVWDRFSLKCSKVLVHNDWVWSLVPHDTTVVSTAGSSIYVWETDPDARLDLVSKVHNGNAYSLVRSHTGKLLFTGGEDGSIHMFEMIRSPKCTARKISTWIPHTGQVNSLAFEFPWLVSGSSDGKISLIDVRELLKSRRKHLNPKVEPPQRMLSGFGCNLFSVGIGSDRIVGGGEEGVIRIWNFSQALEIEQRIRALRAVRLDNRMRRRRFQEEAGGRGNHDDKFPVAANRNPITGAKIGWHGKRRATGKVKS